MASKRHAEGSGTAGPESQDKKSPVPNKSAVSKVQKDIQELFETEYSAKDRGARILLIAKLFAEAARTKSDKVSLFAFLSEADEIQVAINFAKVIF